MGARPYDPAIGRFLSVDPVEDGTSNGYAYVDDPTNEFDLNGMWCLVHNKNGGCKGAGVAKKVGGAVAKTLDNPWVQGIVTIAACSTGYGCAAALYGFAAYNSARNFQKNGINAKSIGYAGLQIGVARVSMGRMKPVPKSTVTMRSPKLAMSYEVSRSSVIRGNVMTVGRNTLIQTTGTLTGMAYNCEFKSFRC